MKGIISKIEDSRMLHEIGDEALVRYFFYESEGLEKHEVVLSKEEFLLCYNRWVKEQQPAENTEKVRHGWKRYTVNMLIDRLEEVEDKSKKILVQDSEGNLDAVGGVHRCAGTTYIFGYAHPEKNSRFDRDKITLSVEQFLQHLYHAQSQDPILGNTVVIYSKESLSIKAVLVDSDSFTNAVILCAPNVPDDEVK